MRKKFSGILKSLHRQCEISGEIGSQPGVPGESAFRMFCRLLVLVVVGYWLVVVSIGASKN